MDGIFDLTRADTSALITTPLPEGDADMAYQEKRAAFLFSWRILQRAVRLGLDVDFDAITLKVYRLRDEAIAARRAA